MSFVSLPPRLQRTLRGLVFVAALLAALTLAASAQEASAQEPLPFVPVWIDGTCKLSDADVEAAMGGIAAVDTNPSYIVYLVHGFDVSRDEGKADFSTVAQRLHEQFGKIGKKVVVVGIQWDSDVDGNALTLAGLYAEKVPQARKTGRWAVRQVMLAAAKRFPGAHFDLMAHSMGCEVSAAAVAPELQFEENEGQVEIFEPGQDVHLDMAVLAGSDLDYDIWYKGHPKTMTGNPRLRFLWMTMSNYIGGTRDQVLKYRNTIRGRAGGDSFPRMTEEQYDRIVGNRGILIDNKSIPESHDFVKYYDDARLARICPTMVYLADPKGTRPPQEIAELDAVLAAPPQVEALRRFLDGPNASTGLYALWRLEHLLCGGSQHLASEYLAGLALEMRHKPREVRKVQKDGTSPCETVKQRIWPTEKAFTRAGAPAWAAP